MARPLRRNVADGWYHVFHRGTERRRIYADDRDREHFLELLASVHEQYRMRIHAYSLMENHYHAILQTPDANLSAAMQWLHQSHAAWYNARHARVGPFWQGRFGSVPIENSAWAYQVSLYVHVNPVCTEIFNQGKRQRKIEGHGLCVPSREAVTARLKALREYRWSSYRAYGGYGKRPDWLTTDELLMRAHRAAAERQKRYRTDAKMLVSRGVDETKRERLTDRFAIGSESFRRALKDAASGGDRETSGKRELRRRMTFQEIVEAAERLDGRQWPAIINERGGTTRMLVMWAARRYGGMTLREIGDHMGGRDYAAVSVALKRFEARTKTSRKITALRQRLSRMLNVET